MRVLIGTTEIAGTINDFATGFREAGHQVTTCILDRNPLYPDATYDVDLAVERWFKRMPKAIAKNANPLVRAPRGATVRCLQFGQLLRLALSHDLFVFLWAGTSLTKGNKEFPFLKAIGKKIVSIFLGSDVREVASFAEEYRRHDQSVSDEFIKTLAQRSGDSIDTLIDRIRHAELYSDVIYSQPNQSNLAVRPYMHLYLPADLSRLIYHVPSREVPVVVHAPSSSAVKGTREIQNALNELRSEQIPFDLRILSNLPNEEILKALSNADVVVDQLYSGGYGKLSIESMASGCAVATRRHDVFWPDNPQLPIHHIDRNGLKSQLRQLLTDRSLRTRLAIDARAFIEQHHTARRIADSILSTLEQVSSPDFRYDYYPRFFFDRFPERLDEKRARQIVLRTGLPADLVDNPAFTQRLFGEMEFRRSVKTWK